MATVSSTGPVTLRRMMPILVASTTGTAIEWYDFFLFGFLSAAVFPKLFFPTLDPLTGTIASFTTNFVGFAARPLGGAFFGWLGDRIGRKATLVSTLLLMGIATALMGFMPGYTSIGIAAPILISVLRFLQGAGVGGEWGGSVLLAMEYGDDRRRGFWASWPQTGVPIGLALASIALLVFKSAFPGAAFISIGWRIPFFLSLLLVIVGLYIRLNILETPSFTKVKEENRLSKSPFLDTFRYHWREVILTALVRSAEQAPFYLFTTFVLTYVASVLKMDTTFIFDAIIVTAIIEFCTIPLFSIFSDRIGRTRWFAIGSVLMALFAFPYYWLLNTKNPAIIVIAVILSVALFHAWLYGPEAALISERFGTKVRYSGASLGYQLASVTAGGPAPLIAVALLKAYHSFVPVAIYIMIMGVISLVAALLLKDYARKAAVEDAA